MDRLVLFYGFYMVNVRALKDYYVILKFNFWDIVMLGISVNFSLCSLCEDVVMVTIFRHCIWILGYINAFLLGCLLKLMPGHMCLLMMCWVSFDFSWEAFLLILTWIKAKALGWNCCEYAFVQDMLNLLWDPSFFFFNAKSGNTWKNNNTF